MPANPPVAAGMADDDLPVDEYIRTHPRAFKTFVVEGVPGEDHRLLTWDEMEAWLAAHPESPFRLDEAAGGLVRKR